MISSSDMPGGNISLGTPWPNIATYFCSNSNFLSSKPLISSSINLRIKYNVLSSIIILHSCSTREFGRKHKFTCEKFILLYRLFVTSDIYRKASRSNSLSVMFCNFLIILWANASKYGSLRYGKVLFSISSMPHSCSLHYGSYRADAGYHLPILCYLAPLSLCLVRSSLPASLIFTACSFCLSLSLMLMVSGTLFPQACSYSTQAA